MAFRPRRRNLRRRAVRRGLRRVPRPIRSLMPRTPSFTETYAFPRGNLNVVAGVGAGTVFKVSFHDIPQWPQYMNLYQQYRINWVKVMLLPSFDTTSNDSANTTALGWAGMARIAYSIQNTPGTTAPATENEVLSDNGCKIKPIGSKWSCSFKSVPDISVTTVAGVIPTKNKFGQWFNFDQVTTGNNPEHGAVTAFISVPGIAGTNDVSLQYTCYYKVNFSLRDPQ